MLVLNSSKDGHIEIVHAGETMRIYFDEKVKVKIDAPRSFDVTRSDAGRRKPREDRN